MAIQAKADGNRTADKVIAIAASAGGVTAVRDVLADLPATLDAAVLVVIHLSPTHKSELDLIYDRVAPQRVTMARDGDQPLSGRIYLAPPGQHLVVDASRTLRLTSEPPQHFTRPSAEPLFISAALAYGPATTLVVLTGNGADGSDSLPAAKRLGATIFVQDPAEAEHAGMPEAAIATGFVDEILPLADVSKRLRSRVAPSRH